MATSTHADPLEGRYAAIGDVRGGPLIGVELVGDETLAPAPERARHHEWDA